MRKSTLAGSSKNKDYDEEITISLLEAISEGNLSEVKRLLQKGANVNAKGNLNPYVYGYVGNTPLVFAAEEGFLDIVEELLKVPSIDVNGKDDFHVTALHKASQKGHLEIVKTLLEVKGIQVNAVDRKIGVTPLHAAAWNGQTEVVKVLLKVPGIRINQKNIHGQTPLHLASQSGLTETVKALLDDPGILVNEKDDFNNHTPLHLAADLHHPDVVRALLSHTDIEVNVIDKYGQTPLHTSAYHGDVEIIKMLFAAGIDAKLETCQGYTALYWASKKGHVAVVEMITDYLQNPAQYRVHKNPRDGHVADLYQRMKISDPTHGERQANDASSQLLAAVKHEDLQKVEELLKLPDVDVNATDKDKNTPLHLASALGHAGIVKLLLETPSIDVNAKNKDTSKLIYPVHWGDNPDRAKLDIGKTPLLLAVEKGHVEVVKLLLNRKEIDVNAKDKYDSASINKAVSINSIEIVNLLLNHPKTDVNAKDTCNDHYTPLHAAVETKDLEIIEALLNHPNIKLNEIERYRESTPLHLAVKRNNVVILKAVLNHPKVEVNSLNKFNNTSLEEAVEEIFNGIKVIEALLEHPNINVNQKVGYDDGTSLHTAAEQGKLAIVEALLNHPKINATMRDKNGKTPYDLAMKNKHWLCVNALEKFNK